MASSSIEERPEPASDFSEVSSDEDGSEDSSEDEDAQGEHEDAQGENKHEEGLGEVYIAVQLKRAVVDLGNRHPDQSRANVQRVGSIQDAIDKCDVKRQTRSNHVEIWNLFLDCRTKYKALGPNDDVCGVFEEFLSVSEKVSAARKATVDLKDIKAFVHVLCSHNQGTQQEEDEILEALDTVFVMNPTLPKYANVRQNYIGTFKGLEEGGIGIYNVGWHNFKFITASYNQEYVKHDVSYKRRRKPKRTRR